MDVVIEPIEFNRKNEWEKYIASKEVATYVDYFSWREAIETVYGLKNYWYAAKIEGKVEGILALTLTRHPLFGSYLTTAPFGSRGGFYANNNTVYNALLNKAEELRKKLQVQYVLIRHLDGDITPPAGWRQSPIYRSFRVRTNMDAQSMLYDIITRKARNQIKKSLKSGYKLKYGSEELFEHTWYVIIRGMKYLGSPYHSKRFLKAILNAFADNVKFAVVYDHLENPLASFLCIHHNNTLSPVHGGFIRKDGDSYVGVFLYWSIIEVCCAQGIQWLDLGRSLINSPNEHFKEKYQPVQENLAYWYNMPDNKPLPNINQNNPKYKIPRVLWSWLPLSVQTYVGPHVIKGIL